MPDVNSSNDAPLVSVIMPIKNEAAYIEAAIRSILHNDYPADKLEILAVDGMSNDGTREIIQRLADDDPRIRLIDNPAQVVPHALNIGIKKCRGSHFIILGGHAEMYHDYIKQSVRCLQEHPEAWVVGGCIETIADSFVGTAIAAAMQSRVGVGNAAFRLGNFDGYVDTLAFGIHHRWITDRIGWFDETLVRNQDDDFNWRILQAGGRIWLSRAIRSKYYARLSLKKLWRQYFQYGFWRIRTMQKHGQPATPRQLAPVLLVSSMIGLGVLSVAHPLFAWLFVAELGVYAIGLIYGAVDVARKSSFKCSVIAPLIFVILHFGYGLGSLWGIWRFIVLHGRGLSSPEEYRLSR